MGIEVDVQYALASPDLPTEQSIEHWVEVALASHRGDAELTVRIVDAAEGEELNVRWRHGDGPTNVLSFPFAAPPGVDTALLGDIVICAPVAQREARERDIAEDAHWAHLVVHGVLHLLGYDHAESKEAEEMERLEIEVLAVLGYSDPYAEERVHG